MIFIEGKNGYCEVILSIFEYNLIYFLRRDMMIGGMIRIGVGKNILVIVVFINVWNRNKLFILINKNLYYNGNIDFV